MLNAYRQPTTVGERVGAAVKTVTDNVQNVAQNVGQGVRNVVNEFAQPSSFGSDAPSSFLDANSVVAKIAFLILVLILFVVLFALGLNIMLYFTSTSTNPYYVVDGMIDGNSALTESAQSVLRSNNKPYGMEFTWSAWLQVNNMVVQPQNPAQFGANYQHVFNKGNGAYDQYGIATVNNGPGLYISKQPTGEAQLHVVMDTVSGQGANNSSLSIDVTGIPLNQKWFHVAIRMENTLMDVYVNGTISGRLIIENVAKQNYGDIFICQNGGFAGKLSNLYYYPRALSAFEINRIVSTGPNTTPSSLVARANGTKYQPYYLSNLWYYSKM